ncbi:MAG: helix-turn-helix transcriptional regulator [Niabella sp.]
MSSTLKILRELNDYTQEYVAEDVLGISQTTYARIEKDPSKITGAYAQKLAALYDVNIANLLSEATPIITFQPKSISGNNGSNGYSLGSNNHFHEGAIKAIKEQNELLIKQNAELMELVKTLGGKLAGK